MKSKKIIALFGLFLILASLLLSSCATKEGVAQAQTPATAEASLIVIDSAGNALPIVYSFSREVNGMNYYLSDGKELTKQEILSTLEPQGMTVRYVSEIWNTSITDVFALFTTEQLYARNSRGAATNAALLYDLWDCLTNGPPEIREHPREILDGLVPNINMRLIVFDFLEQRKAAYFSY
jgi:predicted small secreted protein